MFENHRKNLIKHCLKTWSLRRSNSVTSQVNLNKCVNANIEKIQMRHFGWFSYTLIRLLRSSLWQAFRWTPRQLWIRWIRIRSWILWWIPWIRSAWFMLKIGFEYKTKFRDFLRNFEISRAFLSWLRNHTRGYATVPVTHSTFTSS